MLYNFKYTRTEMLEQLGINLLYISLKNPFYFYTTIFICLKNITKQKELIYVGSNVKYNFY